MQNRNIIVVIGGSASHAPFVATSKKLGFYCITFDKEYNSPSREISNEFYTISTDDKQSILIN